MEHSRQVGRVFFLCGWMICVGRAAWSEAYQRPRTVPEVAADVELVPEFRPTTSADVGRRFLKVENSPSVAEVRQIEHVRSMGLSGFTIFNYGRGETEPMKWLKVGCLKER